jgi:hypothetical protein
MRYSDGAVQGHFFALSFYTVFPIDCYGQRVALLFVSGEEYGAPGVPRIYCGFPDGRVVRYNFSMPGSYSLWDALHLSLFAKASPPFYEGDCAGGCWEYYAHFIRSFSEEEACSLCRDALGLVKWDPYVVRRIGWRRRWAQVIAEASVYPRVSARGSGSPRVLGETSNYPRVSASASQTGARVTAEPDNFPRVSAKIRIADQEADMQATPLCPSEMGWLMDNVLELASVQDDMQDPAADITSANSVTVEIWDRDTDQELAVSPVTLSQVGVTNAWRESILVNDANGFSQKQRLVLIFIFDGGAGLQGRFYALAVVAAKAA